MEEFKNYKDYEKHYSEEGLMNKLVYKGKNIGTKLIYNVLILYYITQSPDVSKEDKLLIYGGLGYFILPIDLIPDFIPVFGYMDDMSVLTYIIYKVFSLITPEIQEQAKKKIHDWFGETDEEDFYLLR